MDTKTKILIGVAVLLVVIFIMGTGAGLAGGKGGRISLDQPWVQNIGNTLAAPQGLAAKDVQSDNPQSCPVSTSLTVPKGGTCRYTIVSSSATTRRLPLQSAMAVTLALHPPDGSKNAIDANLVLPDSAQTSHLDIYQDGGALTITCENNNPAACVFSLAP